MFFVFTFGKDNTTSLNTSIFEISLGNSGKSDKNSLVEPPEKVTTFSKFAFDSK